MKLLTSALKLSSVLALSAAFSFANAQTPPSTSKLENAQNASSKATKAANGAGTPASTQRKRMKDGKITDEGKDASHIGVLSPGQTAVGTAAENGKKTDTAPTTSENGTKQQKGAEKPTK